MKIVYGKRFKRSARDISAKLQVKLAELLEILKEKPFHPFLHTKPLAGELKGIFSFRINRDWRATFYFLDENTIYLLEVDNRKDIYR